jgi:hypothetical protein
MVGIVQIVSDVTHLGAALRIGRGAEDQPLDVLPNEGGTASTAIS